MRQQALTTRQVAFFALRIVFIRRTPPPPGRGCCASDRFCPKNFTYDGDGVKVMQVYTGGETTLTTRYYMGGAYEVTSEEGQSDTIRKYYSLSGITVATLVTNGQGQVDDGEDMYYFLTDHLGSVVGVMDASGTLVAEQRYMPFGQVRTDVGTIDQTDFGYTFQRNLPNMGLMDYKARFYDANIGRFVQPDGIIPGPLSSSSWNEYAYVTNKPITLIDPNGHGSCRNFNDGQGCITNWRTEDKSARPFAPTIKHDAIIEQQRRQHSSTPPATNSETYTPEIDWLDEEFKITYYTLAYETDPAYADAYLIYVTGLPTNVQYNWKFIESVKMQGTGLGRDGKYITIDWNRTQATGDYVYTYGQGGAYGAPIAWQTVATTNPDLPPGTIITISDYPGMYFTVTDTGGGLASNQIDIYIGLESMSTATELGARKGSRVGIVEADLK
jgi:RHS repeat-associated protein